MGCYNVYCHVTGIPILPGQPAVACIVADHTTYGMATPEILPWFAHGVVDYYGEIEGYPAPGNSENYDNPVLFHREAFDFLEGHLERSRPGYRAFVDAPANKKPLDTRDDDWLDRVFKTVTRKPRKNGKAYDLPETFKGPYMVAMLSYKTNQDWFQGQGIPDPSVSDIIRAHWLGELIRETPCLGRLVPYARGAQEYWDDPKNLTARSLHELRTQIFGDFSQGSDPEDTEDLD